MAAVGLAEDTETPGEPVGQVVVAGAVRRDCQADGGGGPGVGGAVNPTTEALPQEPGHQGKTGGAADQVDAGDVGQVRAPVVHPADQRGHRGQGPLNERCARRVQVGHRQDDVLASEDDEHPTALRGEVLLGVAALVQQVVELSGGEVLLGDARPAEGHRGHEQVDVVPAQVSQPVRGQHLVRRADDVDQ